MVDMNGSHFEPLATKRSHSVQKRESKVVFDDKIHP